MAVSLDEICTRLSEQLFRACGARVEVVCRAAGSWTLVGPPAAVRAAGGWMVRQGLWTGEGVAQEVDGERFEYFAG